MFTSFFTRFRKTTAVTLVTTMIFSLLTPVVFAAASITIVAIPNGSIVTASGATESQSADVLANWTVSVDWGDATPLQTGIPVTLTNQNPNKFGTWTANHTYAANGTYTITATFYKNLTVEATSTTSVTVVDNVGPVISQVTPVPSPTNDTTPSYTFTSNEAGTITYGGSCSSATTAAVVGSNTITFNALTSGTYADCTITVTDAATNVGNTLTVNTFTIDTVAPVVTQGTPVPSPTSDTTPNYTFSTTEAGTITYGGSCSSATTTAVVGSNTITLNTLTDGTYDDCTITVTDSAGNSTLLAINTFTVDTIAPVLSLPANITEEAVSSAGNVVTFSATSTDTDPANPTVNCTPASGSTFPIATTTVNCSATDATGNTSNGSFTVTVQDTTKPVITLNGGTINLNVGDAYTELGATALDTVDGDITHLIVIDATGVNNLLPGSYLVTYNVTDSHLNAAITVNRSVNVSDITGPVIIGVPADIVVEQVGTASAVVTYTLPTALDDVDGVVPVVCTPASGASFPFGVTVVSCSASDLNLPIANVSVASFNVTVQDTIAPTATTVTIASDNADTTLAEVGDTITVLFTTSEPVNLPTATIAGNAATVTDLGGNNYSATYLVTAMETQWPVAITIDFSDIATNPAVQITATTDASSVNIDTVAPVVTQGTPVPSPTSDTTPNYTFSTTEAGTITYGGSCSSATTTAVVGSNTITLNTLTDGTYDDCTITVTDSAGNSTLLAINTFTVDTTTPPPSGGGGVVDPTGGVGTPPTPVPETTTTTTTTPTPTPEPTPTPTPEPTPTPTPEPTPTPAPTPAPEPQTPPTPAPAPAPTPAPATGGGTTGGTGGTGGTPIAFNPADATLDIGGGVEPEATTEIVEEETFDPADATLDQGGWVATEERSYTLLWILLGLLALLNFWWFIVAKNKKEEEEAYRN